MQPESTGFLCRQLINLSHISKVPLLTACVLSKAWPGERQAERLRERGIKAAKAGLEDRAVIKHIEMKTRAKILWPSPCFTP